jgi:hypothetical protein
MVLEQHLLANFGLTVIPVLGVLSDPSLRVKTEPGVDLGMPFATLQEACLVLTPGILLLPPPVGTPFCWRHRPESGDFV